MASGDAESLRFLVNPAYHQRIAEGREKEATPDKRKRYKNRINELHRTMMKGAAPDAGLKAAHDAFIGSAIKYVRLEEAREVLQSDLSGVVVGQPSRSSPPPLDLTSAGAKGFGRAPPARTIDTFVTRTSRKPAMPPPRRRRLVRRRKKSDSIVDGEGQNQEEVEVVATAQKEQAGGEKNEEANGISRMRPGKDAASPNTVVHERG
jgi:hypothetical protein